MKTTITLKIGADLAKATKVIAARRGTSLSRFVADQLAVAVRRDNGYEAAKRRALAELANPKDLGCVVQKIDAASRMSYSAVSRASRRGRIYCAKHEIAVDRLMDLNGDRGD